MINVSEIAAEIRDAPGPAPRSHRYPFRDRSCWPVAIVVQAGKGVPLEAGQLAPEGVRSTGDSEPLELLELEATFVERQLERAGYDVRRINSGRYSELRDLLRDQDVVERIVVFHYCGHADRRFIALADGNGEPIPIDARGLSQQLGSANNTLKLIYVNGCLTDTQDGEFRSVFSNVAFIGNKLEVPDDFALEVATTFYRRFAGLREEGDNRGTAHTELDKAWEGTRGEFEAVHNGLIDAAVHADIRDGGFCLAEGEALIADNLLAARRSRSFDGFTLFAIVTAAVAALFSYLAHVWPDTSSPAFQAAFSLVPEVEHRDRIQPLLEESNSTGFLPVCDSEERDALLGNPQPFYGFAVEATRTAIMAFILFMFATVCYRWRAKAHPHFFSSTWKNWFTLPENRVFWALWIGVAFTVVVYHIHYAPSSLGNLSPGGNHSWYAARWAYFQCSQPLFASFFEAGALAFSDGEIAEKASAEWDGLEGRLYARPYFFYMFYSLIVYLALAIPAMMILTLGIVMDAEMIRLRLSALRVSIRQANDLARWEQERSRNDEASEVSTRRGDARNEGVLAISERYQREIGEIGTSLGRFCTAFSLLVLFVVYETLIGRTTTAFIADLMTILALVTFSLAILRLPRLWRSYRDQTSHLLTLLEGLSRDTGDSRYAVALRRVNRRPALLFGPQGAIVAVSNGILLWAAWLLSVAADWTTVFEGAQ